MDTGVLGLVFLGGLALLLGIPLVLTARGMIADIKIIRKRAVDKKGAEPSSGS